MTVFHHNVQILELADTALRDRLLRIAQLRRALILELDATHLLIDSRDVRSVLRACERAGIRVRVTTYGK